MGQLRRKGRLSKSLMYFPDDAVHLHLIHPLNFANLLLTVRNGKQETGRPKAKIFRVEVHRGLPDVSAEPRKSVENCEFRLVEVVDLLLEVHTKPLNYEYLRDDSVLKHRDGGKFIVDEKSKAQEKGWTCNVYWQAF